MRDEHFPKTFWYIASTAGMVLLYVMMITFIPIPKENQRFVDIALAFLLGWLSSNSQYLTGGTPLTKKEQKTTTEVTEQGTTTVTEPVTPKE